MTNTTDRAPAFVDEPEGFASTYPAPFVAGVRTLAERISSLQFARHRNAGRPEDLAERWSTVRIRPRRRFVAIDIDTSGAYLVEVKTGEVVGIKAYGVPNYRHRYGNISDTSRFAWGAYRTPTKSREAPIPVAGGVTP